MTRVEAVAELRRLAEVWRARAAAMEASGITLDGTCRTPARLREDAAELDAWPDALERS